MLPQTDSEASTIVRMRVQATNLDPLAAQLRLSGLLSGAQFHPTVLPRSAILFVRKLSDPMPGGLDLETPDLRPPRAWQEALTKSLDRITAAAAYPARGFVGNDSKAVIFLSHSELLSCLAHDWLASTLTTRWWWQSFLRKGGGSEIVTQLWREAPECVPAALQHLAKQHLATTFVSNLSEREVHQMVGSLARRFGLQALQRTLETRLPGLSTAATDLEFGSSVTAGSDNDAVDGAARAPWLDRVPETESRQLSSEQQRFLGIALMIQRAPAQARSRTFAQEVERWQEEVARRVQDNRDELNALARAEDQVESRPDGSIDTGIVSSIQREQNTARGHREVADAQPAVIHDADERQSRSKSFNEASSSTVAASDVPPHDSLGTKVLLPTLEPAACVTDVRESEPEVSGLTQPDIVAAVSLDDSVAAASVEIETQLGGLFYLINLALYLNLYGDFTMPAAPGIELNIWDFVALVGAELNSDALEEDPIWLLLAKLAGRDEAEAPGSSFAPDDEWRLPPEWLSMFGDDRPWRWNSLGTQASRPAKHARGVRTQTRSPRTGLRRLRVLHPEGFLILDLPLAKDVREQLQSEIKRYDVSESSLSRGRMPKLLPLRSKVSAPPEVRRWLSLLMPYVRARLGLALGLESDQDIPTTLCQRYARVRATDTHIDVFYRLADLPLQIRFAGLDRDPGWVPAAGRFITFHFD